ncbi:MAG: metal ABC transporter substrate-binding protein [Gammaproteobacteria bacterium]|nr:metal ABC transporter substrate-binding protein [Gammaproteobacteria bacterium]MDH3538214.1 metal ABC transporter substrate-binding protein [Gammaproteobacteria bacterium]
MRLILLLLCLQSGVLCAAPRVVASIVPLQELAAALMAGIAGPETIMEDHASIHHFALKPSHMRRLQQADLVIWIERNFEAGFNRLPEILPASTRQLELLPLLGIDPGQGHIWYSPQRLMQSAELIAAALQELDPGNRETYQHNSDALLAEISLWRSQARARLQTLPLAYVTDHAFLGHFEQDMGLAAIATLHDQHDSHGGLHDLNRVEALLRQSPASCLLTVATPPGPLARRLAHKYRLKIVNVAAMPLARENPVKVLQRLDRLLAGLASCR